MNSTDLATPLAALVAGVITSAHCALMCGPLGCVLFGSKARAPGEMRAAAAGYHLARIASYSFIGALLGGAGAGASGIFHAPLSRLLPWIMALFFVVIAFGWERRLPRLPLVGHWLLQLSRRAAALPPRQAAAVLGLATPFLPCGPLYLAFGTALVSGSWITGAALLAAFALGTVPLYVLGQLGAMRVQAGFTSGAQLWTRRILAIGSALLIGGRATVHDGSLLAPLRCLLCH
jgi:sulfite exporter TauE/SafE